MTLKEIGIRLQRAFPGRSISLDMDVWSHAGNKTGNVDTRMRLWDAELKQLIECVSLEDGIAKLKALLPTTGEPSIDIEPTLEPEPTRVEAAAPATPQAVNPEDTTQPTGGTHEH